MEKFVRFLIWFVAITASLLNMLPYRDVSVIFNETRQRPVTRYIIIHHDKIAHETTISDIDNYHRNHNQWGSGFAYNFYLKDNEVYQVKPSDAPTANALNHNNDAVAICVHGDFDNEEVTKVVEIELWILIQYLKFKYPEAELKCHCDLNNTHCCGSNLINLIRKWQKSQN